MDRPMMACARDIQEEKVRIDIADGAIYSKTAQCMVIGERQPERPSMATVTQRCFTDRRRPHMFAQTPHVYMPAYHS